MSTQTQEIIFWIHDKVICCGIRLYAVDYTRQLNCAPSYTTWTLIFVIYDTPKASIFGALTSYVYSGLSIKHLENRHCL